MRFNKIAIAAAMLWAGLAQATCYSTYWSDGVLATQTSTPPVDLSLPLAEGLADRFGPGVTMVISDQHVFCGKQEQAAPTRSLADAVREANEAAALVKTTEVASTSLKTKLR
jgi:hypothetical protein